MSEEFPPQPGHPDLNPGVGGGTGKVVEGIGGG